MKRFIIFVLSIVLMLSLCGCSFKEAISAEATEYIVTAMGFDEQGNKIKIYLETLMINAEDADADKKLVLLEGEGETVKEALWQAYEKTAQPLMLSHLGVAVIGNGIKDDRFDEILDFCYDIDEINLSMRWVTAESAEKLLSCEPVSSVAVGYDIMSMLSEQTGRTGGEYKNRFYELEAANELPLRLLALPYFIVKDKSFFTDGLILFKDSTPAMRLDTEQASLYAIATNTQGEGSVFSQGAEYKVKASYSNFTFSKGADNPRLYIDLRLDGKNKTDKIKSGIEELFRLSKTAGVDIFGIGNAIYHKKPKEWDKIKEEYETVYKNLKLTVEMQ